MLKQLLTTAYLLTLTAAPVQAQTPEASAQKVGEIIGQYYCYALGQGVTNVNQFIRFVNTQEDYEVNDAILKAEEWKNEGYQSIYQSYIFGIYKYTNQNCWINFQRYLDSVE